MTSAPQLARLPDAGGRLQRRKARTRAAILSAAAELFHRQGFEETSIVQIAEAASTGVGTVYGYFSSKEEILREVLREGSEQAVERYRAAITTDTPAVDRICTALRNMVDYITENRTILQAAFLSAARDRRVDEHMMMEVHESFCSLIREGIHRRQLRNVPIDTTARTLISVHMMASLGIGVWDGREGDPQTIAELETLTRAMLTPA